MVVQKLANYEQMLARWKKDIKELIIFNGVMGFGVGAIEALMISLYGSEVNIHLDFWRAFAMLVPVIIILMVPPVLMGAGPRPYPEDVKRKS